MKKIALFFALLVCVVACFAQNCTINGRMNVPAFQNKEVRLLNDVTWETIATTTIKDSAFSFTVPASEPHWAMITTVTASGSNNYFLDVVVEPGIITCDLVTDELAGTPNNDAYGKFHQDIQKEISIYHSFPAKFENIQNMSEQEIEQLKAETVGQKKKISDMALQAIKEMRMSWVQLMDDTRNATNMYGISGIPQIMLIGKDGTILARNLFNDEIEEAVQNALK